MWQLSDSEILTASFHALLWNPRFWASHFMRTRFRLMSVRHVHCSRCWPLYEIALHEKSRSPSSVCNPVFSLVSVVDEFRAKTHHKDTENTKIAQRTRAYNLIPRLTVDIFGFDQCADLKTRSTGLMFTVIQNSYSLHFTVTHDGLSAISEDMNSNSEKFSSQIIPWAKRSSLQSSS